MKMRQGILSTRWGWWVVLLLFQKSHGTNFISMGYWTLLVNKNQEFV